MKQKQRALSQERARSPATLLLVDDEPAVLDGLALTLRTEPYEVVRAQSGAEALDLIRRLPVDIVVSDEQMLGMSGSELLAQVARERPWIGRIMLTGHASLDAAVRSINVCKVAFFLRKPCAPDELRASLAEALRSTIATPAPVGASFGELTAEEVSRLSARERDVLDLILAGKRPTRIAKALFVSPHTVRNHLKALFRKLGVHSQDQLREKCRGD
jgi:DNA-binding NarL/FixJ family response regulator